MMSRVIALASVAAIASCRGGSKGQADDGDAAPAPPPLAFLPTTVADAAALADAGAAADPVAMAERGKTLYGRYCGFCHGDKGQGYAADEAPRLASDDLLSIASDEYLESAIVKGRPGTTMSAWSLARGGPLGATQAKEIVAYLRTWQTRPAEAVDGRKLAGDPARGAATYAASCATCHGKKGEGGKYNALANPELLGAASDGFLAASIERGRAGTPMVAFGQKLGDEGVADVVALLRSWQRPYDETVDLPPRPGALRSVVINPRGKSPAFDPKADFVPVDLVKKERDKGASMVIVDARASGDYARMHVAGAISVPFYEVAAYAPQIPKDRFVLTYCACPHAASVKARDALRALGFARVAVLDEGINVWRDRGYPVRGGSKP